MKTVHLTQRELDYLRSRVGHYNGSRNVIAADVEQKLRHADMTGDSGLGSVVLPLSTLVS